MLAPLLTLSLAALSVAAVPLAKRANDCTGISSVPKPERNGFSYSSDCSNLFNNNVIINKVELNTASGFTILSKTGISAVPEVYIVGSIGVAPAAETYLTGFSLDATKTGSYSADSYMIHDGTAYGADNTNSPSPLAITDAGHAYDIGMGIEKPTFINAGAGNLDTLSLYKGLYQWTTDVMLPAGGILNLNGELGDVFVFQTSGAYNFGNKAQVILNGKLDSSSIYWFAATSFDLGQQAVFYGLMSTYTTITIRESAVVHGRLQAQTFVALLGGAQLTIA